jgi:glycine dehydrogenase subunit 2
MTIRTQAIPDVGAKTPVPALEPLLFELARPGRHGRHVRSTDTPEIPEHFKRKAPLRLPELTEPQVVRHYTHLAQLNYSVDTGMYPLGSCTMKYNPKVNDRVAALFADVHPRQSYRTTQGVLALAYELELILAKVTGMDFVSLQPQAGAQSEFTALLVFKAYHAKRGEAAQRRRIIVPDSAHGTNPASAAFAGYQVKELKSNSRGTLDLDVLEQHVNEDVAALMITVPNTLGVFEGEIRAMADILHVKGAYLYCDGANLNAFVGIARPGDMGIDCIHSNLHKTFSTPHGGGGPGAGPVGVSERLVPFLPTPTIERRDNGAFYLDDSHPESIGRMRAFNGNFNVLVRALTYMRSMGPTGLRRIAQLAVLNANYIRARLRRFYHLPYDAPSLHEVVFSDKLQTPRDVHTLDIAKRLMDYGFHPPTIYFPLIVSGALMIEPTESEPKEELDAFCDAMILIARETEERPELVRSAPHTTPVRRLDEARAARQPILRWKK